jgi:hypothetical protein
MANSIRSVSPPNETLPEVCWGPIPSAYKELITELSADGEYTTCSFCQVHNPDARNGGFEDGVNVRDSYKKVTLDDISHLCGKVDI